MAKKSLEEVEKLKVQWQSDPCWDIENTEGFEEHKVELLAYRKNASLNGNKCIWSGRSRLTNKQNPWVSKEYTDCSSSKKDYLNVTQKLSKP